MKIFFSCGETSGDRYASELIIALKKHDSDIAIFANGGSYIAEQGAIIEPTWACLLYTSPSPRARG